MKKLFALDPELGADGKPVVIVGTGRMALLVHTCLLQEGVAVEAFCDLSDAHVGEAIMGRPVVGPAECRERYADAQIVYAGEDPARAEAELAQLGVADAWIDLRTYDIVNDAVWTFM